MIRKASQDDIASIAQIIKSLDFPGFKVSSSENIKKRMTKEDWYVLEENRKLRAVIALAYNEKSCEIYAIASNVKGGGSELIKHAINICREKKITKLWCWSMARYQAEGFYKKMGFEERHLSKKQFYNEDYWLLVKVIS